jgi:predicted secreted protein with PEFG-CTERM motif
MYNKEYALLAILLASVASVALVAPVYAQTTAVTVQTDKTGYQTGDTIKISGKINVQSGTVNQPALLQVTDPQGNRVRLDQVTPAADGSYNYTFTAGGLMNTDGAYKVIVTYKGTSGTATFQFKAVAGSQTAGGGQWKTSTLNVGGKSYDVKYQISSGSVTGMTLDSNTTTLAISVSNTTSDGKLQLQLPRNVIDAKQGADGRSGADTSFAVFIDGAQNVEPDESTPTADMRQISINFPAGSEKIEVVGTSAVPEFGAIAAIVLAISIVGIILATTKYNNKLNFTRL